MKKRVYRMKHKAINKPNNEQKEVASVKGSKLFKRSKKAVEKSEE